MNTDPAPHAQTWTDKQLMLEAEVIVGGGYGIQPVYSVLRQVRDDLQATIDRQAQRIAELEAQLEQARKWLPESALMEDSDE